LDVPIFNIIPAQLQHQTQQQQQHQTQQQQQQQQQQKYQNENQTNQNNQKHQQQQEIGLKEDISIEITILRVRSWKRKKIVGFARFPFKFLLEERLKNGECMVDFYSPNGNPIRKQFRKQELQLKMSVSIELCDYCGNVLASVIQSNPSSSDLVEKSLKLLREMIDHNDDEKLPYSLTSQNSLLIPSTLTSSSKAVATYVNTHLFNALSTHLLNKSSSVPIQLKIQIVSFVRELLSKRILSSF